MKKPTYWVVEKDTSNPLWEVFLKWHNIQAWWKSVNTICIYYWYDWSEGWNWYHFGSKIEDFENSPTLITLEQWNNWFNATHMKKIYKTWDIYEDYASLIPLPKDKTASELWFKEWDLFVVVDDDDNFEKWEIISLFQDDTSICPLFSNWNNKGYMLFYELAKLPQEEHQEQKPSTKKYTYSTQHVRSDWVVFTQDTIDGKSIEEVREEMKSLMSQWARLKEMLRKHSTLKF